MTRKALQHQLDSLAFDVGHYIAKRYHQSRQIDDRLRHITPAHLQSMMRVIEGFRAMNISDNEGVQIGIHNRLPKEWQRQFDFCFGENLTGYNHGNDEIKTPPASSEERYPRWHMTNWTCSCGSQNTLWYKTHLAIADRYQIYCSSCRSLSGWGTKKESETVKKLGAGQDLVIQHPLDRNRYAPPPIMAHPTSLQQSQIRTKRSQSSVRTKRSQTSVRTKQSHITRNTRKSAK